nr:hypothetical protein [Hypnea pseudomusciformis]
MTKIILNSLVSWKSLPWIKISQRIFIIQQKVYKFSRRCNQYKVHKLQDYIMNSSDIKLFAIQKIINNINKYYNNYSKTKYRIKDIEKLYIYINLFYFQKCKQSLKIILEYIKQYLVYICLKPEWEAKLEPAYKLDLGILNQSSYINHARHFLYGKNQSTNKSHIFTLFINRNTQYLAVIYCIKRIQSLPSIQYCINNWLNYQNIKNIYHDLYTSIFHCLYILISCIISNGLEWYLIYTLNIFEKNNQTFRNIYTIFNNYNIEIYVNHFSLYQIYINCIKLFYFHYLFFLHIYGIGIKNR